MIATCNACQTRFRVADDKVGPRGVKVRCSKCQTIFLVLPGPAAPAAPPPRAPAAPAGDPFADPFARAAGPARASLPDSDPFATGGGSPVPDPFAAPPAGDSFVMTASAAAPPRPDPFTVPPDPFGLEPPGPARSPGRPAPGHEGATDLSDLVAQGSHSSPGARPAARAESSAPYEPGFSVSELGGAAESTDLGGGSGLELDLPSRPAPAAVPDRATTASRPTAQAAQEWAEHPVRASPGGAPTRSTVLAAAPERPPAPPGPSRARVAAVNVLSLAALLAVAVGFFMFWRGEGRIDLRRLFQRDGATTVSAPGQPLVLAARMTNGVYETASGRGLIFVRGELQPQGAAEGPIRVKVALLDGERVAAEVEGLAGAVPTPEELHDIGSAADAEKLLRRIAERAPPRARPGEWLPFLVPLADVPADRGLALRVRAETGR